MGSTRLRGVGKRYGRGRPVLGDVRLDLEAGELTAIVGGNGSGKSTLLKIVAGASRPTTGSVRGRPAVVGYVPERFPAGERLSPVAYLTHMGRLRGLSTQEAAKRAARWLERLALAGGAETALHRLSKGNLQKVALAQAVLVPPRLLVLDEPWSGLDVSAHGVLAEILAEVAGAGGAVAFTDHRESVVRAHATTVYRIEAGRVVPETTSAVTRVVLRPPSGEHRAVDWTALAGVLAVTSEEERTTVRVKTSETDQLLLAALRAGWSVARAEAR